MIAAPEGANDTHLQALSKLSTILLKEEVRKQLLEAQTEEEALAIINEHDVQEEEEAAVSVAENEPFVVAVTACPTGIAHTNWNCSYVYVRRFFKGKS